jgi:hypothetical protein
MALANGTLDQRRSVSATPFKNSAIARSRLESVMDEPAFDS